jgi:hypothetical protein
MLQSNNTLTASQIKSLNLTFNTWLAMEFDNGKYFLLADMKRIAVFSTRKAQLNTFNKARRMLIGYGGNNINEGLNGEGARTRSCRTNWRKRICKHNNYRRKINITTNRPA